MRERKLVGRRGLADDDDDDGFQVPLYSLRFLLQHNYIPLRI